MSPADRKLLLRIALRMERQAKEAYEAAGRTESAKSTRDNIMGDVLDLRDFSERQEIADTTTLVTSEMSAVGAAKIATARERGGEPDDLNLATDVFVAMKRSVKT